MPFAPEYLEPFLATAADDATAKANAAAAIGEAAAQAAQATPSRIRMVMGATLPATPAGSTQSVTLSWTPFPTTAYVVVPTLVGTMGGVQLGSFWISNKTVGGCTLNLRNAGLVSLLATALTLDVLIVHTALS